MERTKKGTLAASPVAEKVNEETVEQRNPEIIEELPEKEITEIPIRKKLTYKKINGGNLRFGGMTIKPGGIFEAHPEQLPQAFMDSIICLSNPDEQKADKVLLDGLYGKEMLFDIVPAIAKDWYNVINTITRKPINEKTLKLADAEKLRNSLNL